MYIYIYNLENINEHAGPQQGKVAGCHRPAFGAFSQVSYNSESQYDAKEYNSMESFSFEPYHLINLCMDAITWRLSQVGWRPSLLVTRSY